MLWKIIASNLQNDKRKRVQENDFVVSEISPFSMVISHMKHFGRPFSRHQSCKHVETCRLPNFLSTLGKISHTMRETSATVSPIAHTSCFTTINDHTYYHLHSKSTIITLSETKPPCCRRVALDNEICFRSCVLGHVGRPGRRKSRLQARRFCWILQLQEALFCQWGEFRCLVVCQWNRLSQSFSGTNAAAHSQTTYRSSRFDCRPRIFFVGGDSYDHNERSCAAP